MSPLALKVMMPQLPNHFVEVLEIVHLDGARASPARDPVCVGSGCQ